VFEVTGKSMTIIGRMTFAAASAGTHVEGSFDMPPKGTMKLPLPLMAPMVRRDFPKQFASFKEFCESKAGAQPS
jgi:hypothetical protein